MELYFGERKYRLVNEQAEKPDPKYCEWLDSSEGQKWLDSLTGDESDEKQDDKESLVDSSTNSVSDEAKKAAEVLNQAAEKVTEEGNKQ